MKIGASGGLARSQGVAVVQKAEREGVSDRALISDSTRSWTGMGMCRSGGQTTFSMPAAAGSSAIGDTDAMISARPRTLCCRPRNLALSRWGTRAVLLCSRLAAPTAPCHVARRTRHACVPRVEITEVGGASSQKHNSFHDATSDWLNLSKRQQLAMHGGRQTMNAELIESRCTCVRANSN